MPELTQESIAEFYREDVLELVRSAINSKFSMPTTIEPLDNTSRLRLVLDRKELGCKRVAAEELLLTETRIFAEGAKYVAMGVAGLLECTINSEGRKVVQRMIHHANEAMRCDMGDPAFHPGRYTPPYSAEIFMACQPDQWRHLSSCLDRAELWGALSRMGLVELRKGEEIPC